MTPEQIAELKYKHKEILTLEMSRKQLDASINAVKIALDSDKDKIMQLDVYALSRTEIYFGRAIRQTSLLKLILAQLEDELAFFDKRLADL